MSTFYAAFANWSKARAAVRELVGGGVDPDDLSLIWCKATGSSKGGARLIEQTRSVGDATSYVGRSDDPYRTESIGLPVDVSDLTSVEESPIGPLDTSDSSTDVEAIEESGDSQEQADLATYPRHGISQGRHESDDVALTILTGFPTLPPSIDNLRAPDFEREEQFTDGLEVLEIPGVGFIIGGGGLATAALDFARFEAACSDAGLVPLLTDDGVPLKAAQDIQARLAQGQAVLAVVVTPGDLNEDAVEEIATRSGGDNLGLFDAPRWSMQGS